MRTLKWVLSQLWNHRSNRGRQISTLANAVGWQLRKRVVRAPKSMKVFHGMRMLCYPDSQGAGVMIYSSGWPDFDDMYFVSRYLRPGDAVIDVGANMGIYTLLMGAAVGPSGRLLAFEPGERAFEILTANVRLNQLSQVDLRREVLGSEVGEVRFMRNLGLANRLVVDGESLDDSAWEMLKSTTLDVELDAPFALGKIDVEGAEPLVFAGAMESLAEGNPAVWLMEFKDRLLVKFGWSAERFAAQMRDRGYRLGVYDAERNELSFPDQAWINHDNVLAVAETSVDDVRSRLADGPREIPGAPPLS